MLPLLSRKAEYAYVTLPNDQNTRNPSCDTHPSPSRERAHSCQLLRWFKLTCGSLIILFAGFLLGHQYSQHRSPHDRAIWLEREDRLFKQVPIFGDRPSNKSDEHWNSLMPKRGGFFNHPEIAPERSAFAVFHQLHCLNALREAYWTTLDAATSPVPLNIDEIPFEISPLHMSHCIDLLRQTLMCSPDLTLEIKNLTLGGVTGFGTVHQCRNWHQLMDWMKEWEDVGAPKHVEDDHGHSHHHSM